MTRSGVSWSEMLDDRPRSSDDAHWPLTPARRNWTAWFLGVAVFLAMIFGVASYLR